MCHSMFCKLLLIIEGSSANITIALQRILLIVINPLVFHPSSVAGKNSSALPTADVRFDSGVRIQMALHVGLESVNQRAV